MIRAGHIAVLIAIGYGLNAPKWIIWSVAAILAVILVVQRLSGREPDDDC